MENKLALAMEEIANLPDKKKVAVKGGKLYTQVVTRVEMFRKHLGMEYGIDSQISAFEGGVLCKAYVTKGPDVLGAGHAYTSGISGEKSLEKLESTAIGRAMASIGLSGGEYASDTEMETWKGRYEKEPEQKCVSETPPGQWIQERMVNLQAFVYDSKAPTQVNFDKRAGKIEESDIFTKVSDANKAVWTQTKASLQDALTDRIGED